MRRSITAVVMGALLLLIPALSAAAWAAPTAAAPGIVVDLLAVPSAAQTNQSLNASARVRSTSGNVAVEAITIAVRDASGGQFDFPGAVSATVPASGYTFTSGARTFARAGTYRAFVAVRVAGAWYDLAPAKTFTVGAANAGVVVDSLTLPTSATANQAVTASARLRATGSSRTVQAVTVAVRGVGGKPADFPGAKPATVTAQGTTFTSASTTFPAGSYEAFVAVQVNGTWFNLDPHRIFTVGAATTPPPANPVTFEANFNGPRGASFNDRSQDTKDRAKQFWFTDRCWRSGCMGAVAQYQDDNAKLDGAGNLEITADTAVDRTTVAGNNGKCGAKICSHASARLTMKNWDDGGKATFEQASGHFEARMKLPVGAGLWPAFWTVGEQDGLEGSDKSWPKTGEIDILEALGDKKNLTTAFQYLHGANSAGRDAPVGKGQAIPDGRPISEWHVYSVDWDASDRGYIVWKVDGKETQRITSTSAAGIWPSFQGKHSIILNLAVGGDMPNYGNPKQDDVTGTAFPAKMYVDYVKVYERPMP